VPESPEIGVILLDGSIHDEVIDTQFHVPGVGLGIDRVGVSRTSDDGKRVVVSTDFLAELSSNEYF